ncbi:MAG: hypothetical protein P4L84_27935 [Isosphaeraceae bacterium]|nr:hypothetical protein [Isosphaeraceae bacterium]
MLRYFLVLAVTDGSLLIASFVLGLLASGEHQQPRSTLRDVHFLIALLTTMVTLAVHSIVYTYFLATMKWAKEVVHVYQLPEWINDQAKKNKRKAFRFVFWSITAVAVAAWLGAAAHTRAGLGWPLWHLGAAALALAFNFGAFAVEYAVILSHARLLLEVKARADKLRVERYGPEGAAVAGEVRP